MTTKPESEKDSFIVYGDINCGNGIEILPTYAGEFGDERQVGHFTIRQIYDALRKRNIPFICSAFYLGNLNYRVECLSQTFETDDGDGGIVYNAVFSGGTQYRSNSLDEVMEYVSGA